MIIKLLRKFIGSTRFTMAFMAIVMAVVLREHPIIYSLMIGNTGLWILGETYKKSDAE